MILSSSKNSDFTGAPHPSSDVWHSPVSSAHTLTLRSFDPLTTLNESNSRHVTAPVWPKSARA